MYEMLQLMKEQKFKDKIYPIVMDDTHIFSAQDRIQYIQYWQDEYENLNNKAKNLDLSSLSEIAQELKLFTFIKSEIRRYVFFSVRV